MAISAVALAGALCMWPQGGRGCGCSDGAHDAYQTAIRAMAGVLRFALLSSASNVATSGGRHFKQQPPRARGRVGAGSGCLRRRTWHVARGVVVGSVGFSMLPDQPRSTGPRGQPVFRVLKIIRSPAIWGAA